MKCELKNVKINDKLSEETTCFSATLYVDGVRTAEVANRGTGGCDEYRRVFDPARLAAFRAFVKSLPPEPPLDGKGEPLPMDADLYVANLLEAHEKGRVLRRLEKDCKTKLCFAIPGKDDVAMGAYHYLNTPDSVLARRQLRQKYGDGVEILNDRFLSPERRRAANRGVTA